MISLGQGQICVVVAVAILVEVWYLQICNSCFYQVRESWPMDLVFAYHGFFNKCSHLNAAVQLFSDVITFTDLSDAVHDVQYSQCTSNMRILDFNLTLGRIRISIPG